MRQLGVFLILLVLAGTVVVGSERDRSGLVDVNFVPNDTSITLLGVSPLPNSVTSEASPTMVVRLSGRVDSTTIDTNSVVVFGQRTGRRLLSFTLDTATNEIAISVGGSFSRGEVVTTILTTALRGVDNKPLANAYQWSFRIGMGLGGGGYVVADTIPVEPSPFTLSTADIDRDGSTEITVAHNSASSFILRNRGTGLFAIDDTIEGTSAADSFVPIDVDSDGDVDFVAVSGVAPDSGIASFFRNDGAGKLIHYAAVKVGLHPVQPKPVDVDNDGDLDVVVDNYASHSVSILSNDGVGNFVLTSTIPVGSYPHALAAGDVDADGDVDIVTANLESGTISILLNSGMGTYSPLVPLMVGANPYWVALADIDEDNDLDVVVSKLTESRVLVLRNDGLAQFDAPESIVVGLHPWTIEPSDLDGDGRVDLLVANYSDGTVSVLMNGGGGAFTADRALTTGRGPRGMAVLDVDADQDADIVIANRTENTIVVFHQEVIPSIPLADSTLLAHFPFTGNAGDSSGYGRHGTVIGAVLTEDRFLRSDEAYAFDGVNDNIHVPFDSSEVCTVYTISAWVKATGRSESQSQIIGQPGGVPQLIVLPDGRPSSAKRRPNGEWHRLEGRHPIPLGSWTNLTAIIRPDRMSLYVDGVLDTTAEFADPFYREYDSDLQIGGFFNSGTDRGGPYSYQYFKGSIDDIRLYARELSPEDIFELFTVGGWGEPVGPDTTFVVDSVLPPPNSALASTKPTISIWFDRSIDTLTATSEQIKVFGSYSGLHQLKIEVDPLKRLIHLQPQEDFRHGEQVTVILTSAIRDTGGVALSRPFQWTFRIAMGPGGGFFHPADTLRLGGAPFTIHAADMDDGGALDIVVARTNGPSYVLKGESTGTYSIRDTLWGHTNVDSYAPIDVDADGDLDLVVVSGVSPDSGTVAFLRNNGSGALTQYQTVRSGMHPVQPKAVDVDNDGDLDLAIDNYASHSVSIFKNDGAGVFTFASHVPVGQYPHSLAAGDLDGDGDVDLMTANLHSSSVSVLVNGGQGSFSQRTPIYVGEYPYWVTMSDVDGDGDLDAAVSKLTESRIIVLRNDGDAHLATPSTSFVGLNPWTIEAADIDGDYALDLVVANYTENTLSVLENEGTGTYTNWPNVVTENGPRGLLVGDLDADGDADIVVANRLSGSVVVYLQSDSSVATNLVNEESAPTDFALSTNYPNPFNPKTEFTVRLPATTDVVLAIYDVMGREVARILDGIYPAGEMRISWDASLHSSGIYMYRMKAGKFTQSGKMLLLK